MGGERTAGRVRRGWSDGAGAVVRAAVISTVSNRMPTRDDKSKGMAMKSTGEANDDAKMISIDALLKFCVDAHCPSFSFRLFG